MIKIKLPQVKMKAFIKRSAAVIVSLTLMGGLLSGCALDEDFWDEDFWEEEYSDTDSREERNISDKEYPTIAGNKQTEGSRKIGDTIAGEVRDGKKIGDTIAGEAEGSRKIGDSIAAETAGSTGAASAGNSSFSDNITNAVEKLKGSIKDNPSAVREKQVELKNDGTDKVTVLVYMNGSNLETDDGEATIDLTEMVEAGSSDNVKVVVQTVGTKKWRKKYGIASDHSQIYEVNGDGLTLVKDDLGQLNCADTDTLADFISWGAKNYPADRYILMLWGHGSGPVYGFGYDDRRDDDDALTTDELQQALNKGGVYFDFIGMDCCIMSCLEVCLALNGYCDYMILSEDFESGLGWSYTGWLSKLMENSSTDTVTLAKCAIDDMVADNEQDEDYGDESILALVDESMIKVLFTAWLDFAYANEDKLFGTNYSRKIKRRGRGVFDWILGLLEGDPELSDYYITDIMAVAANINSAEAEALKSAVAQTVIYTKATNGNKGLTGISVTLPYGDNDFYEELERVFLNCGIDKEYISWLSGFTDAEGDETFFDYDDWDDSWEGWDDYDDEYDWEDWEYYDDDEYWEDEDFWGCDSCLSNYCW